MFKGYLVTYLLKFYHQNILHLNFLINLLNFSKKVSDILSSFNANIGLQTASNTDIIPQTIKELSFPCMFEFKDISEDDFNFVQALNLRNKSYMLDPVPVSILQSSHDTIFPVNCIILQVDH